MLEWLISIPGPEFLIYFSAYSLLCILGCKVLIKRGYGSDHPLPALTKYDTVSIAALRGGWQSVLRTVIFGMYRKKTLAIKETKSFGRTKIELSANASRKPEGYLEEAVYSSLFFSTEPKTLFSCNDMITRFERYLAPIYQKLEKDGLIKTENEIRRDYTIFFSTASLIVLLGGAKLVLGVSRNKPVVYLFLLVIFSLLGLYLVIKPNHKATPLGRKYLKKMEEHFSWLCYDLQNDKSTEGIDPAFGVALFGVAGIGYSSMYSPFRHAFAKSAYTGGCGGGCGGGIGGGGGGCGGGCGGCGGCGG